MQIKTNLGVIKKDIIFFVDVPKENRKTEKCLNYGWIEITDNDIDPLLKKDGSDPDTLIVSNIPENVKLIYFKSQSNIHLKVYGSITAVRDGGIDTTCSVVGIEDFDLYMICVNDKTITYESAYFNHRTIFEKQKDVFKVVTSYDKITKQIDRIDALFLQSDVNDIYSAYLARLDKKEVPYIKKGLPKRLVKRA